MMSLLSFTSPIPPYVLPETALSANSCPSSSTSFTSVQPPLVLSLPPPNKGNFAGGRLKINGRSRLQIVRMAPQKVFMTMHPLDYPIEWETAGRSRRPEIFPELTPMKIPLPIPMPADPPLKVEENEEDEERFRREEEGYPEEGEGEGDGEEEGEGDVVHM